MSELTKDVLEKYIQAGEIAGKVREEVQRITKEGMRLIEICEKAERLIKNMDGNLAFPCNISVNEVAAHYTSPPFDEKIVPEGSLVKIDIGVHIDGYIADTAVTVCFNPDYEAMVKTSELALETAIKIIRPGSSTSDIGFKIQNFIENQGFKPISNLTGHQIGRYIIHTGISLPNVSNITFKKIRYGDVFAIEPFVTLNNAVGKVIDKPEAYIFRFLKKKPQRNNEAKYLLKVIESRFRTLPFAKRWLNEYLSLSIYENAFSELLKSKCLRSYPVFVEASGKYVAQAEHTVYIDKNGAVVLT
jgi:methionyl aminopeptidase